MHGPLRFALAAALSIGGVTQEALAVDADDAPAIALRSVRAVAARARTIAPRPKSALSAVRPAERIAMGDMLLRTRDYERAIEAFSKVVELHRQGRMPAASHADGLFLLGESYFQSGQYLSAQRAFREVLNRAGQRPYDSYAGRALSRLVDVALRRDDLESLAYVFERLESLPVADQSGSLQYARAKAYYAKQDYSAARQALSEVVANSSYAHQAQYLSGVILTKQATPDLLLESQPAGQADQPSAGQAPSENQNQPARARYAAAIEQFRKLTRMPADTPAHRHVIDLGWMAVGRLFYESEHYLDAAEAYSHVDRTSPEFTSMLYELAWVYIRLGDYQRAQRALEVLSVTDPDSLQIADGTLLRADLMLRSGQFDKALDVYQRVLQRYEPMREQIDRFLGSISDPAVYYDKLTAEHVSARDTLPPLVMEWAREEAQEDHVFSLIDDVTRSRDLVRKTRELVSKLRAVLASPTRARAFPEVQSALEQSLGLQNKLARARYVLAQGMDDVASSAGGELGAVRRSRRALMRRVLFMPVSDNDFLRREAAGEQQWNKVAQRLQQLTLEIDKLRAIVNGLKRVLHDADAHGVARDPQSRERFKQEIAANERDLETYQQYVKYYRQAIDMGRAQIGFGDQRYVVDDRVRKQFRELFVREAGLAAASGTPAEVDYARRIWPILQQAHALDAHLEAVRAGYEARAATSAHKLLSVVSTEAANVESYARALEELDQNARLLVGEVAMKNFGLVRDRLKNIVLRADVGIVQQAWEVREENRFRVRDLQRERAREEQRLNDELREVLDDAEESD